MVNRTFLAATAAAVLIQSPIYANDSGDPAGGAQEADGHRMIQVEASVKPGDEAVTFAQSFGVDWVPLDEAGLLPLDHQTLFEEDLDFDPLPMRFAVPRNLRVSAQHGRWIDVNGGSLWRILIQSEGAENIRAHITDMNLPLGAEIKIHAPSSPLDIAGPFREDGPFKTGEAWGITAPGDVFIVEYFSPYGQTKKLPFTISDLYHGYRDIFPHDDPATGGIAGAGSCHNDPLCYPEWADVADAVCRLYYQGFVCSGQLTATASEDETPLITTANHCISTQGEANSCEFRFKYRRISCSGGVSQGAASNGAMLVDTYSTSDSTLMMIQDELPTNMFFMGWSTASVPNGTDIVSIHHPAGDYMRISFGDKINSNICGSSSYYHATQWNDGVTEGGSSGSLLCKVSDQKLVGVLTCGASACNNQNGGDGYGRFDRAYTSGGFNGFMQSGSDDSLEDGDSCEDALTLDPGSYSNLVVKSTDEDWYQLSVANGSNINVNLDFIDGNGDIDAQLYDSCGGNMLVNSTSNNNDEIFNYVNNTGATQTYLLRVFLFSDTRNTYSMDLEFVEGSTKPAPDNDLCENATSISNGTYAFTTIGATANGPDAPLGCSSSTGPSVFSDIWYSIVPTCTGLVSLETCGADFDSRVLVYQSSNCSLDAPVQCDDNSCGQAESFEFLAIEGLEYKIRIGSGSQVTGSGQLVVNCQPFGNPPANDDCSNAIEINAGTTEFSTSFSTSSGPDAPLGCSTSNGPSVYNDVWFIYTTDCLGLVTVSTCGTSFDSRVIVYSDNECPDSSSTTAGCEDDNCSTDDSTVQAVTLAGNQLLIRVGSPVQEEGDAIITISCQPFEVPCPEDLNGDNKVDGADIGLLLAQWGSSGSADFNNDGNVNGADIGLLLSAWGDC
jgi:hypothetical protein